MSFNIGSNNSGSGSNSNIRKPITRSNSLKSSLSSSSSTTTTTTSNTTTTASSSSSSSSSSTIPYPSSSSKYITSKNNLSPDLLKLRNQYQQITNRILSKDLDLSFLFENKNNNDFFLLSSVKQVDDEDEDDNDDENDGDEEYDDEKDDENDEE